MINSVVLLSGGISSAVMLAKLVKEQDPHSILALLFDYEYERVAIDLNMAVERAKQAKIQSLIYPMMLAPGQFGLSRADYLYMVAQAARTAYNHDIPLIYAGFNREHDIEEFIRTADLAIMYATMDKIVRPTLYARFKDVPNTDIIQMGQQMGIDFAQTYSCIRPTQSQHCGVCVGCIGRKSAFAMANVPDPTTYNGG